MLKSKKRIVRIIIVCVFVLCAVIFINPVVRYRNYELRSALQSMTYKGGGTLEEAVPFDWDYVYHFTPYMPKEYMTKKMGFESRYVSEAMRDDIVQLYFVKDDRVVAFLNEAMDSDIVSQIPEVMKYGTNQKLGK